MALFIREEEVKRLLSMENAVQAVEEAFRQQALGQAVNRPRTRIHVPGKGSMQLMSGAALYNQVMGLKVYTAFRSGTRFMVVLFSAETGDLLAVIQADHLGRMRTGAASGVASKFMARRDTATVGIIGSGGQAATQLAAVCGARAIRKVRAFSRRPEPLLAFCRSMSQELEVEVSPAGSPQEAVEGADIVITITNSRDPVVNGEWIGEGVHVNAAGSNALNRREVDDVLVRKCGTIVVDSREQARVECGDLLPSVERGVVQWEALTELADVVSRRAAGRTSDREVTLFESQGVALEDVAVGARVLELARAQGAGQEIDIF